jgi:hypothetical protein
MASVSLCRDMLVSRATDYRACLMRAVFTNRVFTKQVLREVEDIFDKNSEQRVFAFVTSTTYGAEGSMNAEERRGAYWACIEALKAVFWAVHWVAEEMPNMKFLVLPSVEYGDRTTYKGWKSGIDVFVLCYDETRGWLF